MDINAIWAVIEPYIMTVAGAIGGGTVVFALVRSLVGGFVKKFAAKYDVNDMADKVAQRLGGKTLNIDVTAVTEKRLDKIENKLSKKVEAIEEQTASYKHLLVLIGGALAHSKSLTEAEKATLLAAVQTLESDYTPPEPEQVSVVKLEPIVFDRKAERQEEDGIINFGGLSL